MHNLQNFLIFYNKLFYINIFIVTQTKYFVKGLFNQ